jgi:hypothetical protein
VLVVPALPNVVAPLVVPALPNVVAPLVVPALPNVVAPLGALVVKFDSNIDNDVRAPAVLPVLISDIAVLITVLACESNALVLVDVLLLVDDVVPLGDVLLVVVVFFFFTAKAEPYKSWPAITPSTSVDAKRAAPRIAKVESFLLIEA